MNFKGKYRRIIANGVWETQPDYLSSAEFSYTASIMYVLIFDRVFKHSYNCLARVYELVGGRLPYTLKTLKVHYNV